MWHRACFHELVRSIWDHYCPLQYMAQLPVVERVERGTTKLTSLAFLVASYPAGNQHIPYCLALLSRWCSELPRWDYLLWHYTFDGICRFAVIKHSNGKSQFSIGNTSSKGSFSIAMLDYQRVDLRFLLQGYIFEGVVLICPISCCSGIKSHKNIIESS